MFRRFTIASHHQEFTCRCGWPCDVGDRATETEGGDVYCSSRCAKEEQETTDED